jgi:hypothetical protein
MIGFVQNIYVILGILVTFSILSTLGVWFITQNIKGRITRMLVRMIGALFVLALLYLIIIAGYTG